jgi:hypothetical protein
VRRSINCMEYQGSNCKSLEAAGQLITQLSGAERRLSRRELPQFGSPASASLWAVMRA